MAVSPPIEDMFKLNHGIQAIMPNRAMGTRLLLSAVPEHMFPVHHHRPLTILHQIRLPGATLRLRVAVPVHHRVAAVPQVLVLHREVIAQEVPAEDKLFLASGMVP
jgi:hypothetical protein